MGLIVEAPDGSRLAYTGDTGPSDAVVEAVRGADLLLIEAALRDPRHDDLERGHLTPEEALELARAAAVRSALLVHYAPPRRAELEALCRAAGPWAGVAVDGLTVTVSPVDVAPWTSRPRPGSPAFDRLASGQTGAMVLTGDGVARGRSRPDRRIGHGPVASRRVRVGRLSEFRGAAQE